jgi:NAD(P)H-hydrate epimerase
MLRLSRSQVREVDHRAIEDYHIPGIVLMENAAIGATHAACDMLDRECIGQVLILCGGGNNGGDGLAVARHLHNRGADVSLALTIDPAHYKGDALINWRIVSAMRLPWSPATPDLIAPSSPTLLIDAIFGTGLSQPPRDPFPALAHAINARRLPTLAIDLPSGLDCDTGHPLGSCIKATRTITFVAEKLGFASPIACDYLGDVTIAPIGCPIELIQQAAALDALVRRAHN